MQAPPLALSGANIATLLQSSAARTPADIALVERERSYTYAALASRAGAIADALGKSGVRTGDRVGILMERGGEAAAAYFGVLARGGLPVILNDALRPRQIGQTLERCSASALLTAGSQGAIARDAAPAGVIVIDTAEVPQEGSFEPVTRLGDDPAQIIYTSGSTGLPKGVTLSHGNLWANIVAVTAYLGLRKDDRVISLLPFSSVYGLNQLICSVACGSTLVVERSPLVSRVLETIQEESVTVLAAVPPLWIQLLKNPANLSEAGGTLRVLQNAGGHLPEHAVRAVRQAVPHASLFLMYGMTEVMRSTYLPPEQTDRRPTSMGRAMPGTEILVLREDLTPCDPGEVGELVHRGPTVALGYWNDPEATEQTFRANPLRVPGTPPTERVVFSGDMVRADEEGFLYFAGRRDRMIKSMGYRLGPDEVADVLYASGEVAEAVVSSEPDDQWGMAVIAHVVLAEGGSADRLRAFCRQEMPRYMQPKRIEVRTNIPRLPGGKYDISALLEEAAPAAAAAP